MASDFGVDDDLGPIVERIRAFFASALPESPLEPDQDYFALGLVNSLLALELVSYVEKSFTIRVDVEDLDLDNFRTMNRIAAFVGGKLAAAR
ncbi:acyl carrier protein [Saccharothrix carnea]|uniref:Acyl carrier protein n=1 Tax=Saccharothrix carnea TaxID=1280637 RepID=A0A2P8IF32_SACCR|nr:acyl carrier protein [Saccharothrix carnea]PSL57067.1 acyl carrier protein [Saccharothrix carnea]